MTSSVWWHRRAAVESALRQIRGEPANFIPIATAAEIRAANIAENRALGIPLSSIRPDEEVADHIGDYEPLPDGAQELNGAEPRGITPYR